MKQAYPSQVASVISRVLYGLDPISDYEKLFDLYNKEKEGTLPPANPSLILSDEDIDIILANINSVLPKKHQEIETILTKIKELKWSHVILSLNGFAKGRYYIYESFQKSDSVAAYIVNIIE